MQRPVVWISWLSIVLSSQTLLAAEAQLRPAEKSRVEAILGGDLPVCRYAAGVLEDAEPADEMTGWYTSPFSDVGWASGNSVGDGYVRLDVDGDGSEELIVRGAIVPYGHRPGMGTWIRVYDAPPGTRGPDALPEWQRRGIAYMGNVTLYGCDLNPTCHAAIADLVPSFRVRHALPDYVKYPNNYFGMIEEIRTPVFISLFKFSDQVFVFLRGLPRNDPFDLAVVGRYDLEAKGGEPVRELCILLESRK